MVTMAGMLLSFPGGLKLTHPLNYGQLTYRVVRAYNGNLRNNWILTVYNLLPHLQHN